MDDRIISFAKSPRKGKKYRVFFIDNNELNSVDFGAIGYDQYKDSTGLGLYSHLDHLDEKRRYRYRARHSKIKLKDGRLAFKVFGTPAYFSWNFLWQWMVVLPFYIKW